MTTDPDLARRPITLDRLRELAIECRTWGRWGTSDELGAANHLTDDHVLRAASLVRTGRVFPLGLPMGIEGPQTGARGRVNPQHVMLQDGSTVHEALTRGEPIAFTDDAVYLPLQASTQWDALCHVFFEGVTYNGADWTSVTSGGASRNSITNLQRRSVGRGVLVDVPRALGVEALEPGDAIQRELFERVLESQGVTVGAGDFILVRTGHLERRRSSGDWTGYVAGPAPGIAISTAMMLAEAGVVAIATDTWAAEVIPWETTDESVRAPVHLLMLVNAGVYLGEMWDLEELALECARDGVYEFLLAAPPLPITGAVGSPLNPLAIR